MSEKDLSDVTYIIEISETGASRMVEGEELKTILELAKYKDDTEETMSYADGELGDVVYVDETDEPFPDPESVPSSPIVQNAPDAPGTQSTLSRVLRKLGLKR